ncbi:MAG: hypothetical protein J6W19_07585 [Prevotella sp.]|nr:hypothetical protein [Prevotella sp.]
MNKKIMKMLLPSLLVCMISMMAGCSVNDEEYVDLRPRIADSEVFYIYEGEWSVNKQVVDTARMEVRANGKIEVRLPEHYLLSLCFPDETDMAIETSNSASLIEVHEQGYSETSQYMSIGSDMTQTNEAETFFINSSFMAAIDRTPYSIQLLSREYATAVIQNTTGQWTLSIPIDGFALTNLYLSTDESETVELPQTVTIYYNTKRRIE